MIRCSQVGTDFLMDDGHGVLRDLAVLGEDGYAFEQRLRDEYAIEWIAVMPRKRAAIDDVSELDAEDRQAQLADGGVDQGLETVGQA